MKAALGMVVVAAVAVLAGCAQAPLAEPAASAPTAAQQLTLDLTSCSRPVYPPQAAADKVEGTSYIGFLVGPDGKVITSRIYTSSGDASLDEAARSALSQCTFKPPMYKGKPVSAWLPVQYVWTLDQSPAGNPQ